MDVVDAQPFSATVALILAVVEGVAILRVWQSTRPKRVEPGEATMDLREETPALVDLLTGGFEVEDDAVPATAIDLATRGWYDIEDVGGRVLLRLRSRPDEQLTAYESRVVRHVERNATQGVTPAAVMTLGPDGVSERWFKGFVREVTKDGRKRGLCLRRYDLKHLAYSWLLVAVAIAPAWIVLAAAPRIEDPTGWGSIGNLILGIAILAGLSTAWLALRVTRTDGQRDTPAGREAAAHWLGVRDYYRESGRFEDKPAASVAIWERHLAYATAMGLAPEVQRQLPFETEHDRHAWSRATGRWRRVKIRYQSFRPGWGQHPGRVAFAGLVQAVVFGVVAYFAFYVSRADSELDSLDDQQRRWVGLAALIIAIACAVVVLTALTRLVIGVADLIPRNTLEGEVVRRRTYRTGHRLPRLFQWAMYSGTDEHGMRRDFNRKTKHHLAIDDGTDDQIVALSVGPQIFQRAPQGARVRIKVSPLLGYVSALEITAAPPSTVGAEPAVLHPLAESTLDVASRSAAGTLERALATASTMTDESGQPILDQTDDEGVTLRERLAESQGQLDRMRSDPRIANSPIAGILDNLGGALAGGQGDQEQGGELPPPVR
ncbi:MAG: DUF2207 domain-containing protein [Acidimicrobiia bacterium]|nr:DUF2207 domain-containing protein [Acidimicrobiia bacterium]